jgi:hypothetical protein
MRINVDLENFKNNIGKSKFIHQISDYLQINPNRITLTSIQSGSTILKFIITPDILPIT